MSISMSRKQAARLGICGLALCAMGGHRLPSSSVRALLLWEFTDMAEGGGPSGPLITDPATGVLYGSAYSGGLGYGTVYSLVQGANKAWSVSPLYQFTGGADGAGPIGRLVEDSAGNLYGVTGGGAQGWGTVFMLTPPQSGTQWQITTLYTFTHGADGGVPEAGLTGGANGSLFGTTARAGADGWGTAFMLSPPSAGQTVWTFNTIYTFTGAADGGAPLASLLLDQAGNLYGTASRGGTNSISGTVFELSPPAVGGTAYTETTLWAFSGPDGSYPASALIGDAAGNLYGTAPFGGSIGQGVAFELSPPQAQGGAWTESTLWNFSMASGTAYPFGGLLADSRGNLYGASYGYLVETFPSTTSAIYVLSPPSQSGQAWTETQLIQVPQALGFDMKDSLGVTANGNLIGTAQQIDKRGEQGDNTPRGSIMEIQHTGYR